MSKVYAFLADGFEETEAIAVIDVLLRGDIQVKTVSINDTTKVTGVHGIVMMADQTIEETDMDDADMLFLPGGVPGTPNLAANEKLTNALIKYNQSEKRIAAICAAPYILGELGFLKGREATVFPGFEDKLEGAKEYTRAGVVTDGHITTARGMGVAIDLGLELVSLLKDKELADEVAKRIQLV